MDIYSTAAETDGRERYWNSLVKIRWQSKYFQQKVSKELMDQTLSWTSNSKRIS